MAAKTHAWVSHWKASGPTSYSDHILLQRIYSGDGGGPKIDDQIDGLGERIVALFGNESVDGVKVSKEATRIHQGIKGLGLVAGALELEQEALQKVADVTSRISKGPAELRIGLDNFVRELADARSTVIYLLKQRLKGDAVDNYGAAGEISPYASALFPVVVSTAAGGILAHTTSKMALVDGALLGAGFGVVWAILQLRQQGPGAGEVLEVVTERALPNNVFRLSDHPDFGALTPEAEEAKAKRTRKLLGWGLVGLMGWVAYYNYREGAGR
tara:strand:- start:956 stop:1768 length:813 start_codon:yes stop_codon:yes gene_type:complete